MLLMLPLVLAACSPKPAIAPQPGDLLIAELYTSGAAPAGGADHYFSDQFIELVNASQDPLDLSRVMVADVYGVAGEINPGTQPDSYRDSHPDEVVMSSVWQLPDGVRLEPGESLVIAHDGGNHRPFSAVDLSDADFEAFVADSERDEDSALVDNLQEVAFNGGYDWLMTVFGPSVVVLRADTALSTEPGPFGDLPVASADAVLDGVDTVMDADSGAFKRLPDAVDSGFAWVAGPYSGESLHRVQNDGEWQDTDDSSADFHVGDPDPTRPSESGDVSGDARLELGTGTSAFEPLAEGADVELVEGAQGGWHLDVALAGWGFGPGGALVEYEAVDSGAERLSFVTRAELSESGVLVLDDGWQRVGDRVVLDIDTAADVVGSELVLRVTAELAGQTWSDERRVVVVDER